MISWRERGPGRARLGTLLAPRSSLPRSPGPAALCPSPAAAGKLLQDRACQRGTLRGSDEGSGSRGRGHIPPEHVSKDIRWEPPPRTMSLWPRLLGFRWTLGSHHISLNSSPSSHFDGLPFAKSWEPAETCRRPEQDARRGACGAKSKATAFPIQLNIARLPTRLPSCSACPFQPLLLLCSQKDLPKCKQHRVNPLTEGLVAPHYSG